MKQLITFLIASFLSTSSFAQYWIFKSNVDLSVLYYGYEGVSGYAFTIDSMAYFHSDATFNNFRAYNINTNTWIGKADFPIATVYTNQGFEINGMGYLAVEGSSSFYQYNPITDSWLAKAAYPDTVTGPYVFAIGNFGYMVSGVNPINYVYSTKCYKYDPSLNTWTRLNDITWPNGGLEAGTSGAINGKGYCCLGIRQGSEYPLNILWEYDPGTDSWTSKANFPGNINIIDFIPTGCIWGSQIYMTDAYDQYSWTYNPTTNQWSKYLPPFPAPCGFTADFGGGEPLCFTINNHVFVGYDVVGPSLCGPNANSNYFYELDTSIHFSLQSYSPSSPDSICENYPITVTFNSNAAFSADNNFRLLFVNYAAYNRATSDSVPGNQSGTYTFGVPPGTIYSSNIAPDSFYVVSSDPAIMFDRSKGFKNVEEGALQQPFAPSYSVCNGAPVQLNGTTQNYPYGSSGYLEWYYWANSPGNYNTVPDSLPSKTISSAVNTTWYFKSVNISDGCMFFDTIAINTGPQLAPNLPVTAAAICPGNSFTFGGAAVPGCIYQWSGPGISSNASSITVSPTAASNYNLVVSDSGTTCQAQYNLTASVNQPLAQTICFVTVDSSSSYNVVIWEKTNKYATDSFYIYREITTDNYQRIGAMGGDDLSQYNDYTSNPNIASYQYKLSAVDTCLQEGSLSDFHNTIHLEYLGSGNLIWNAYVIESETTPVSSFDVYRDSAGNGDWQLLISLPGNETAATDPNFYLSPNSRYRVTANWTYSCVPSRDAGTSVESNIIYQRGASGINELEEYSPLLYPNPAKETLTIESAFFVTGKMNVVMYDLTGEMVNTSYQQEQDKLTFNISKLPGGIYFLKFSNAGRSLNVKFVKTE